MIKCYAKLMREINAPAIDAPLAIPQTRELTPLLASPNEAASKPVHIKRMPGLDLTFHPVGLTIEITNPEL
jgi:hypothetical protein